MGTTTLSSLACCRARPFQRPTAFSSEQNHPSPHPCHALPSPCPSDREMRARAGKNRTKFSASFPQAQVTTRNRPGASHITRAASTTASQSTIGSFQKRKRTKFPSCCRPTPPLAWLHPDTCFCSNCQCHCQLLTRPCHPQTPSKPQCFFPQTRRATQPCCPATVTSNGGGPLQKTTKPTPQNVTSARPVCFRSPHRHPAVPYQADCPCCGGTVRCQAEASQPNQLCWRWGQGQGRRR